MTKSQRTQEKERYVQIFPTGQDNEHIVEITIVTPRKTKEPKKETFTYLLERIRSDWGRGFRVSKIDGTRYYVMIDPKDGNSCDCPGYERWGHCKHVDSIQAMVEQELI